MNEQLLLAIVGLGGVLLRHYFPKLGNYIPGGSPTPATPQPVAPSPWVPAPIPVPEPTVPAKALTDCLEWAARARANLVIVTQADRTAVTSLCEILHGLTPPPAPVAPPK